ncbi:thiamine diphosphokinase [Weissella kandleri]|uniref:thiamine diphosphokinase n=1 Tax=Weissella kandleri TaxID=1616 RepID=UPI00387EA4C7
MTHTVLPQDRMRILLGGPHSEWPDELKNGELSGPWAAADRGTIDLITLNQPPIFAIGDFDSISPVERRKIDQVVPTVVQKFEQISTDTQALLKAVDQQFSPKCIEVYGATGGRLDHALGNIWMFIEPEFRELAQRVVLIDRNNEIRFYLPGSHTIQHNPEFRYLGFAALEPVVNLELPDEKYSLQWSGGPKIWGSNEFNGSQNHFSFEQGMIAVIQSKDVKQS